MNALLACALALGLAQATEDPTDDTQPVEFVLPAEGDGPALYLPREETLVYAVRVDVAFMNAAVGKVTQTTRVEPFQQSLFAKALGGGEAREAATIAIHAKGDYTLYSLDSTIESRHLPQVWPSVVYRQISDGTSKRRRENMIGVKDGVSTSSYRQDTSNGAPEGTRIWRDAKSREIPKGTIDMLSAVYACRTLIREEREELTFPMIEKDRLWELTLRRGEEKRIETGAGPIDAVEVLLVPAPWRDETIDEENVERFEGLFGLKGSIHVWVDKKTGVTVRIQGDLPVGPLTLGVDVLLDSYSGTPEDFAPIGAAPTTASAPARR